MTYATFHRLGLAVVLLAAIAGSARPLEAASRRSKPAQPEAIDSLPAASAKLVVGDWYEVKIVRGQVESPALGCLIAVTKKWIVLRSSAVMASRDAVPVLSDIPLMGRLFTHDTSQRRECDLWIPREAAFLTSHQTAAEMDEFKIPRAPIEIANEPPPTVGCNVHRVVDGEKKLTHGDLIASKLASVVMSVQHSEETRDDEFSLADTLAIEVPVMTFPKADVPVARKAPNQVTR